MDRREFMSWVGVGFVASSLPLAIAACTDSTNSTAAPETTPPTVPTATRPDGFIVVGTVAKLDEQKFVEATAGTDPVLVVRDTQQPNQLIAVSSKCTHEGCKVAWEAKNGIFACPCHGSKFAANGEVKQGPAQQPLKTVLAKIEGTSVLLKST